MSADDLIVSLRKDASPEESALAEAVGRHDGDAVPFHMFAKIAVRAHRHGEWIGEVESTKKWFRRNSRMSIGFVIVNLFAGAGFLLHNASERGAAEEHALNFERVTQERAASEARWAQERREAMEREIQDLRSQLVEIRAAMRRMSGLSPDPSGDMDMPWIPLPDKVTSLRGPACTIFASPSP